MGKQTGDLATYQFKSKVYKNVKLYESHDFETNIIRSKRKDVSESWIIATNGDVKRAIEDYGYRIGGIETIFKHQKSNGFYIENTVNCSLKYFETMYTMACFTTLYLTILGSDFAKNSKCYKNVKIKTHTTSHGKMDLCQVFRHNFSRFCYL